MWIWGHFFDLLKWPTLLVSLKRVVGKDLKMKPHTECGALWFLKHLNLFPSVCFVVSLRSRQGRASLLCKSPRVIEVQ